MSARSQDDADGELLLLMNGQTAGCAGVEVNTDRLCWSQTSWELEARNGQIVRAVRARIDDLSRGDSNGFCRAVDKGNTEK